jgi:endosialidase-like protein
MVRHAPHTAALFSVLLAALMVSLSLAGGAAAQSNTSLGAGALQNNTTGGFNIAIGALALGSNTTGSANTASGTLALGSNTAGGANTASGFYALLSNTIGASNTASGAYALDANTTGASNTASGAYALDANTTGSINTASGTYALLNTTTGGANTASGVLALSNNTTGNLNTAIGYGADVAAGDLVNATAIGFAALVNASNKIRLGNGGVTVIEGQVAFTSSSDKTKKENFRPVDGEEVLAKIRGFALTSWNFIGHDPKAFRHYGPMAQDFFAAFGHDEVGQIGAETTINAGDMAGILMIAVQALEQRTAALQHKEAQIAGLASTVEDLQAQYAYLETVTARLERLEAAAAQAATLARR